MPSKSSRRDPIGAHQRGATAARRIGDGGRCACGETRPEALIQGRTPTICAACERRRLGQTELDDHHVFGRANSPVTIRVPVNDHRADLSVAQYDWPKETRENSDGSPFLSAAAHIRGFIDTIVYLTNQLRWIPELLEMSHGYLSKLLGPKWWLRTELRRFKPKR